MLHR
jgi:hypothetical protein